MSKEADAALEQYKHMLDAINMQAEKDMRDLRQTYADNIRDVLLTYKHNGGTKFTILYHYSMKHLLVVDFEEIER